MFCNKCGKKIADNIKFCNYCGAALPVQVAVVPPKEVVQPKPTPAPIPEPPKPTPQQVSIQPQPIPVQPQPIPVQPQPNLEQPKKKKNWMKVPLIILSVLLVIAALGAGGYYYLKSRRTEINLNNYIQIQATGYNEYGTITWKFDEEKFKQDYQDIKIDKDVVKSDRSYHSVAEQIQTLDTPAIAILNNMSGSFSKDKNLINGEETVLTLSEKDGLEAVLDVLKCKVIHSDITCVVESLKELESFNPFDYFDYSLYGYNGKGTLEVYPIEDEMVKNRLIFEVDKTSGLSDGDQVKVTAKINDAKAFEEEFGKRMSTTEKTYKIDGLAVADVTEFSQIDSATMEDLKKYVDEFYRQYAKDDWIFEYDIKDLKYMGYYFKTIKEPTEGKNSNELYIVYKPKVSFWELEVDGFEYYYVMKFTNLQLDSKDKCIVNKQGADFGRQELKLKSKINPYTYVLGYETIADLEKYINVKDNAYNIVSEMSK